MCFPFSLRKRQHINKFDPHPFPGQSRKIVFMFIVSFFPTTIVSPNSTVISSILLGTFKQGVSKQGVMTFAWRPGSQYDVAAKRGADTVLASDCRAQFGRPSTRRGCRICVTVPLPVRPCRETMYWQANANTPLPVTPLLNVPYSKCGHRL